MTSQGFTARAASVFAGLASLTIFVAWAVVGNYAAYVGAIFVLFAFLASLPQGQWREVIRAPWVWALVMAFLLLTFAFIAQPAPGSSESIGDFIIFALAPVFAVAVLPLAKKRITIAHVGWVFWAGALVAAAWAIYRSSQGDHRPTAIELSPIHFADLAMLCGFLGLVVLFDKTTRWRWLALTGPLFALVVALISETRAAVLVGMCLAIVFSMFLWRAVKIATWKKVLCLACVPVAMVGAFYLANLLGYGRAFQAFETIAKVFTGDASVDTSANGRVEMYRAALFAIADSPWIGHGWHNQMTASYAYMSEVGQRQYDVEQWSYIHNDFLSLTVSAGVFGAVSYALALAAPLLAVRWTKGRDWRLIYIAVVTSVGLFLSGATDVLFMVEVPKIFLVMTAAVLFALSQTQSANESHG